MELDHKAARTSTLTNASLPTNSRAVIASDLKGMAQQSLNHLNNLLYDAHGIAGLNSEGTRARFEKALSNNWIEIYENTIHLTPVVKLPDVLMHRGRDTQLTRDGMRMHDVFGNPAHGFPTYLSTREMRCEADAWDSWDRTFTSAQKILIEIDPVKLLESRSIYIDPESLMFTTGLGGGRDEVGEMFMILGGIPRSAIRTLTRPWYSDDNLRAHWPNVQ